jgi:2-aminoadipate transaminase
MLPCQTGNKRLSGCVGSNGQVDIPMSPEALSTEYSERARAGAIRSASLFPAAEHKYRFAQGLPFAPLIPVEKIRECFDAVLTEAGSSACTYYSEEGGGGEMKYGFVGLRNQIAKRHVANTGQHFDARNVLLTNGSIDGLALTAAAFLNSGDGAIVESPTFSPVATAMETTGAEVRGVQVEDDGMDMNALEATLMSMRSDGLRPKLIYTIPTFQLPTGTVMSLAKRRRLLELAHQWNVMVLEDNCYYDLAYDSAPPPSLLALDDEGIVIQSDSTSKYIAPGLRLGWMVGTPLAMDALARTRQDFAVGQVLARSINEYFERGYFDSHLSVLRDAYRVKRDLTEASLEKFCRPFATHRVPTGGFYFWLELTSEIDFELAKQRINEAGISVRFSDTERFAPDAPAIRLCPIQESDENIVNGIEALGAALAASTKGGSLR